MRRNINSCPTDVMGCGLEVVGCRGGNIRPSSIVLVTILCEPLLNEKGLRYQGNGDM